VVLDGAEVTEQGRPIELASTGGLFAKLFGVAVTSEARPV
jgi:hypothetical protein